MAVESKIISFWKQVKLKSSDMFTKFKVGIGVKVPTHKLHIKDATDPMKLEGVAADTASSTKFLILDSNDVVKHTTVSGTSSEDIQDIVGAMFTGNTETRIAATYEDSDGTIDLVVDAIPVDLTVDGAGTVHTNNITDLHGAGVNGSANQFLTDDGDGTVTSEPDLTFASSILQVGPDDSSSITIKRKTHGDDAGGQLVLKSGNATGTNKNGGDLRFHSGLGTGNGDGGEIRFKVSAAGSSGSTAHSDPFTSVLTLTSQLATIIGTLQVTGDIISSGDGFTFTSADSTEPLFIIKNTTNDANGARLQLVKDKGAAGAADDVNGLIQFIGDDANQDQVMFSEIKSQVKVHTDGQEGGKFTVSVAEHDGTSTAGLVIEDGNADGELDVTIASGAASVTHVSGNLTVGGTVDGIDIATDVAANTAKVDLTVNGAGTIHSNNVPTLNQSTTGNASTANIAATSTVVDAAAASTTYYPVLVDGLTGAQALEAESELTFVGNTGILTATGFAGALTGDVTGNASGSSGSCTGNAATATNLTAGDKSLAGIITAKGFVQVDNRNLTIGVDGHAIHIDASDLTDASTSASGTNATYNHITFENPRLMATNSSVTTTNASTVYIKGSPVASTNQTITNAYALYVQNGGSYFGGDLTVNGDSVTFESANADDPIFTLKNTSNDTNDPAQMIFVKDRGAAPAVGTNIGEVRFVGEDSAQNSQEYGGFLCEIDVATDGQESGQFGIWVATHDGELQYGIQLTGGSEEDEVDVSIGQGVNSVTTIAGNLDVTGNVLPGITYVKILPSDFMPDDGGRPAMIDDTGSDRWLESHGTSKLYAFVDIPVGFKATHVDVYGSATSAVTVYEADVNSKTVTSKGTGNIGTQINITDVNSDATNYILIELAQASGEEVYGGKLTIAKI